MKIVSLLPSATEIVCALGLREHLVGVTHECDYPPDVAGLPKVTRTLIPAEAGSREIDGLVRERLETGRALYSLDAPMLAALQPDVIVTQSLCDVCAVSDTEVQAAVCSLRSAPRLVNLEPVRLDDVLAGLHAVARAVGAETQAESRIADLKRRIETVRTRSEHLANRRRTILLEWIDPPFSSGHWNPEIVTLAGGEELIGQAGARSRTVEWAEIRAADPEVLVISCCGFSVERGKKDLGILRSYPGWQELSCVRSEEVFVVDGNAYFSRPGPRLVDSLELMAHILHPDVHPLPVGMQVPFRVSQ